MRYIPFDRMTKTSPAPIALPSLRNNLQFQLGRKSEQLLWNQQNRGVEEVRALRGLRRCENVPNACCDNQAAGLLFIHDSIRRRIDAHRAFRALSREARQPDLHCRTI